MTRTDKGFVYIWALFAVAIFGIVLAGVGQVWQTKVQREKEQELMFVGDQFRKAIMSYYNNAGDRLQQFPESLEDLLLDDRTQEPKSHLRRIFLDPMTNSYEWGLIKESVSDEEGSSDIFSREGKGVIGVYSRSKNVPLKSDNFPEEYSVFTKADSYQDWKFIFTPEDTADSSKNIHPDKVKKDI